VVPGTRKISIIKYKQKNTVKHSSADDYIKVCSYVVSFNDMFRL